MSPLVKTKRFAFFGTRGPLKLVPKKKTNLHTNSLNNSNLFNEFVCNLDFFWHEWASLKLE
jgi:hypothetical protein